MDRIFSRKGFLSGGVVELVYTSACQVDVSAQRIVGSNPTTPIVPNYVLSASIF